MVRTRDSILGSPLYREAPPADKGNSRITCWLPVNNRPLDHGPIAKERYKGPEEGIDYFLIRKVLGRKPTAEGLDCRGKELQRLLAARFVEEIKGGHH